MLHEEEGGWRGSFDCSKLLRMELEQVGQAGDYRAQQVVNTVRSTTGIYGRLKYYLQLDGDTTVGWRGRRWCRGCPGWLQAGCRSRAIARAPALIRPSNFFNFYFRS